MPTPEEYREAAQQMERLAELDEEEEEVMGEAESVLGVTLDKGFVLSEQDEIMIISKMEGINLTEARKQLSSFPNEYTVDEQNIPDLVHKLRKARRKLKGEQRDKMSKAIDTLIDAYSDHLTKCIDSLTWLSPYQDTFRKMRYNEKDLQKLNKMKDLQSRRTIVDALCKYWEAEQTQKDVSLGKEFSTLQKTMTKAKKEFRDAISKITDQSISKSKKDRIEDFILKSVCETPGIGAKQIHEKMPTSLHKSSTPQSISKSIRKLDITNLNGSYYKFTTEIKKNIWAYTAAFIDSDGYITMDRNHNPRVGLVATGERGKAFMQEIHKSIGFGRLHLDQKSPQDTRPVNRLNFYSQEDVHNLLTKCLPHFRLKKGNANLLLELVRIKKSYKKQDWYKQRCGEIFKLMKWENHKDHVGFDFAKEGIFEDDIQKYKDNCKMSIMDQMEDIGTIIKFDRAGLERSYPKLRNLPDEAVKEFESKINDKFNFESAASIISKLLSKYKNQLRNFRKSEETTVENKLKKRANYA
jgi:hypothetical protein